ncbi:hypothetical protein [Nocardioides sp. HB32]
MKDLAFENEMVLAVVQAGIGVIDPAVQAISIETDASTRTLRINVATTRAFDDPEFPSDLTSEIDALTGGDVRVEIERWNGPDWVNGWPGNDKRMVYAPARPGYGGTSA